MAGYAIVKTGGKQYRVQEGDVLKVEKLEAKLGEEVKLGEVLFAKSEDKTVAGRPQVSCASVTAEVIRQIRAAKVIIFQQRQKKVYKTTIGHRQWLTERR